MQPFQSIRMRTGRRRDEDYGFAPADASAAAPADDDDTERASKRARNTCGNDGAATSSAASSNASAIFAAVSAAVASSSSRKRFSKAHQASSERAVVPTAEVREHVRPVVDEQEEEEDSASVAPPVDAAAASFSSGAATAAASSSRAAAAAAASSSSSNNHGSDTDTSAAAAYFRDAESAAATVARENKIKRRKRKSAAAASAVEKSEAAYASARAAAASAASTGGWSNSLPSTAHFRSPAPQSAAAAAGAQSQLPAELSWARAEFADSRADSVYSEALLDERIEQLRKHMRRQAINVAAGTGTWQSMGGAPGGQASSTLLFGMALVVLLRQEGRMTARHAQALYPLVETAIRENLVPNWMADNMQQLLYRVAPLLSPQQSGALQELLLLMRDRHTNDAYMQAVSQQQHQQQHQRQRTPMGMGSSSSHGSPYKLPQVVSRPAISFGGPLPRSRVHAAGGGPLQGLGGSHICPAYQHSHHHSFAAVAAAQSAALMQHQRRPMAAPLTGPGSSASDAIALDDDDDDAKPITAAHVLAHQRLSVSDAKSFVARSFLADEFVSSMKLPLVDPLTLARIVVPVRSAKCDHVRCFDLDTILMQAAHAESRGKKLTWSASFSIAHLPCLSSATAAAL
jgi:hypothetical protein